MPNATVFEMPAEWEHLGETQRLCRYFTDDELANQRIEQGEWFQSQMMMRPRDYEGGELNIGFSEQRNVMVLTEDELKELKGKHMVVQVCDPSFSRKDKREGDTKSRFSIIHAVVSEEVFIIYNAWQTFGMDTGGIKSVNLNMALEEDIDFFIQDAQGGQTGLYDEQIKLMRDRMRYLRDFKHTKSLGAKLKRQTKYCLCYLKCVKYMLLR